uniref:Alternative protein CAPRIN2 n=1 Tax=Homo sapiens TaxID=9606 RepID=L8E8S3_HUMAN|nr:alternative protein CAPRIN2 [Homo sapiens]
MLENQISQNVGICLLNQMVKRRNRSPLSPGRLLVSTRRYPSLQFP